MNDAKWTGLEFQGQNTKHDKHVYTKSNTLTLTLIPRKHWIYLVVSQENIAVV